MGGFAFGLDVGGTNIEGGLVREDGSIVWQSRRRTEPEKGNEHVMSQIASLVNVGLQESGILPAEVIGIGIGMPGFIDSQRGVSIHSTNLHIRDYPVAAKIKELTGLPVFIENDVRLYVYGESLYRTGQNDRNVLGLTIGTGLAAAMVNEGRIYLGSGFPGEIGHIPIEGVSYPCGCGLTGCLETVVSATGLVRQVQDILSHGDYTDSLLRTRYPDPSHITSKGISDAFDAGDELAAVVLNRTGKLLGRTLAYLVPMLSPDVIIVGGGVACAGERLLGPVKAELYANIMPFYRNKLAVVPAQLGARAGILGSARWAFVQAK